MNNIIKDIIDTVSKHVGDEFLKNIYAISLLSPGINNCEEPIHVHIWGTPESGKTDLQTRFLELVPKEHKDIASDFSPRVLMRSDDLKPGSIISMNDKIFTDSNCTLLNQIADSTSWRKGRVCATIIGSERVNLTFPPRVIFWMNSNKKISDYSLREVDPMAVEGRFLVFQKDYTTEQKMNIFIKRNIYTEEIDENKIEEIRKYINEIYEHPKTILCSEECRNMIWKESLKMDITSIRIIGRYLTMCQVVALTNDRLEVTKEDIEAVFNLLKTEEKPIKKIETSNIKDISDSIKKYLVNKTLFETFSVDKKLQYSSQEIQKKFKVSDICAILDNMEENRVVGKEMQKVGTDRVQTYCYYLI